MRFAVAFLLAACGGQPKVDANFPAAAFMTAASADNALSIVLRTAPAQPPERGLFTAEYAITDSKGAAVAGLTIAVTPWMPDMGHGSTLPTVSDSGDGKYLLSGVNLFMPGLWELRTTISGKDSTTTNFQLQIQ